MNLSENRPVVGICISSFQAWIHLGLLNDLAGPLRFPDLFQAGTTGKVLRKADKGLAASGNFGKYCGIGHGIRVPRLWVWGIVGFSWPG